MLALHDLERQGFRGDIETNEDYRRAYATDASIYREVPIGVVFPRDENDMQLLVTWVSERNLSIIPRGAGTSLAGQCVGNGVVMDVTRYMISVTLDTENGLATVQPGVIRDELNRQLRNSPWFFGPNTSTSNRATLGGMVGNNSSGTTSIAYGVTRDKVVGLKVVLSDGTLATISSSGLVSQSNDSMIVENIATFFERYNSDQKFLTHVKEAYPHPSIHRRCTGYALDALFASSKANETNWLPVLCGSEGTLALIYEITVKLDVKPAPKASVLVSHFASIHKALEQVPTILDCRGVEKLELMDDTIIACARKSEGISEQLFFIEGEPKALLLTEIRASDADELQRRMLDAQRNIKGASSHCIVGADKMDAVWQVRAAGLGILSNIAGDEQALACIEDTAVHPKDLSTYIQTFTDMMRRHGQETVYYAHAGAGELHLRPVLNLKTEKGKADFRSICASTAELVKTYRGSLSGEHGDGRVRAPFIAAFYGDQIYQAFEQLKDAFDPEHIFNPGKIVNPKDLLDDLRVDTLPTQTEDTFYDYAPDTSLFYLAERCNGSADCRKTHDLSPGMCPTYQATNDELLTTRARANLVREALVDDATDFPLTRDHLAIAMSSCVACKACQTQCPSGVDVALMKSEYYRQRRLAGKLSLRDKLLAHPLWMKKWLDRIPFSRSLANSMFAKIGKQLMGLSTKRKLPIPCRNPLSDDYPSVIQGNGMSVVVLIDEFTNYFDQKVGRSVIELLSHLGMTIQVKSWNSGRALLSKGYLEEAEQGAIQTLNVLISVVDDVEAIIGIEPSAVLTFRDEFKRFQRIDQEQLNAVNEKVQLFDAYLLSKARELHELVGSTLNNQKFLYHGHCHQKAACDAQAIPKLFNSFDGVLCKMVQTGCCGMAGSFGYEVEHEELSESIAKLGLIPAIESHSGSVVMASGMSCRHQIHDLTDQQAKHPAEVLLSFVEANK